MFDYDWMMLMMMLFKFLTMLIKFGS
jgi:hypothetical protein